MPKKESRISNAFHHLRLPSLSKLFCFNCKHDFCGDCMAAPFHSGYPCDFVAAPNCIYCERKVSPESLGIEPSPSPGVRRLRDIITEQGADCSWCVEKKELVQLYMRVQEVCERVECRKKLAQACTKLLPCGHWCCGVRGENECPPCLHTQCASRATGKGFDEEKCLICYDDLKSSPVLQLRCSHMYHCECVKELLRKSFPGPEISFKYLCCPLCGSASDSLRNGNISQLMMIHMDHPALVEDLRPHLVLRDAVIRKAKLRLKVEGMMRDPEVLPGGLYDGRPADYALSKFLFYKCYMCGEPYFGGLRRCGVQAIQGDHNPKELICYSCNTKRFNAYCTTHGRSMIEWKCRYCCSVASWFCFGTTHMCDGCHSSGVYADRNFTAPPCDPVTCPLRVKHPPHGQEFCLGCSLCRVNGRTTPATSSSAVLASPLGSVSPCSSAPNTAPHTSTLFNTAFAHNRNSPTSEQTRGFYYDAPGVRIGNTTAEATPVSTPRNGAYSNPNSPAVPSYAGMYSGLKSPSAQSPNMWSAGGYRYGMSNHGGGYSPSPTPPTHTPKGSTCMGHEHDRTPSGVPISPFGYHSPKGSFAGSIPNSPLGGAPWYSGTFAGVPVSPASSAGGYATPRGDIPSPRTPTKANPRFKV